MRGDKMKNKKGRSGPETVIGVFVFLFIVVLFFSSGLFSAIFKAFEGSPFGNMGMWLGLLFVLIIIAALFDKLLGK